MKNVFKAVLLAVIATSLVACGSGYKNKRAKHDAHYKEDKQNAREFEAACYGGDDRACSIVKYSMENIRRYHNTYGAR